MSKCHQLRGGAKPHWLPPVALPQDPNGGAKPPYPHLDSRVRARHFVQFYLYVKKTLLRHLQLILSSAAQAVSKITRFSQISPILNCLHSLELINTSSTNIKQAILKTAYLCIVLSLQANSSTCSSFIITRQRLPNNYCFKTTDTYHSPCSGSRTAFLKSFAILYVTRHLPIYQALLITCSLAPHLSFTLDIRHISLNNHTHRSLFAHFTLSVLWSIRPSVTFHFPCTNIITVTFVHFISSDIRPIMVSI